MAAPDYGYPTDRYETIKARIAQMRDPESWTVVWEPSDHFLARWVLKKGFGHLWAAKRQGDGWLLVNPSYSHIQVAVVTPECMADQMQGKVKWSVPVEQGERIRPMGLQTCTEVIKGLLGIRDMRVLTPYQLYRKVRYTSEVV